MGSVVGSITCPNVNELSTVKLGYNDHGYNERKKLEFLVPNGQFSTKICTVINNNDYNEQNWSVPSIYLY